MDLLKEKDELIKLFNEGKVEEYHERLAELMAKIYLSEVQRVVKESIDKFLELEKAKLN